MPSSTQKKPKLELTVGGKPFLELKSGTVEAPAISFKNDPNTGLWTKTIYELIWEEVEKIEKEKYGI